MEQQNGSSSSANRNFPKTLNLETLNRLGILEGTQFIRALTGTLGENPKL